MTTLLDEIGETNPLVAAFADAARSYREYLDGSLAQAEFEEGLYVDEDEVDQLVEQDDARLAARSESRALPAEYHGGGYTLRMGLSALGEAYVELLAGPGRLKVLDVWLAVGDRGDAPEEEAPDQWVAFDESGAPIVLR